MATSQFRSCAGDTVLYKLAQFALQTANNLVGERRAESLATDAMIRVDRLGAMTPTSAHACLVRILDTLAAHVYYACAQKVVQRIVSSEDVCDVVQKAMYAYYKYRGQKTIASPISCLERIAHRKAVDWVRDRKRQPKWQPFDDDVGDSLPSQTPPTEHETALESSETIAFVERQLQSMDPEKRVALVLRHVNGMSTREIAKKLCVKKEEVHRLIQEAQQALMVALSNT